MLPATDVILAPAAERELKKLTKDRQKDVLAALKRLRDGSETLEIEKIKGHPSFFRIKAGTEMRVIFHPLTTTRCVVLVIRDRKEAALCIKSTKVKGAFSRTSPRGDSLLTYGNGLNFSTTEYCLRHEGRYASGRCDRGATGCGHCYQRCSISSAKLREWLAHREFSRKCSRSVPRKPASGAILGGVDRCLSGRFEFRDTADA